MERAIRLGMAVWLATALAAHAAPAGGDGSGWRPYGSVAKGFTVRFPTAPVVTGTIFPTVGGVMAPSTVYEAEQGSAQLMLTVVDFGPGGDVALAQRLALRGVRAEGAAQRDADRCVSGQTGRELWLTHADGAQSRVLVVAQGQKLYMLEAKASAPVLDQGLADAKRFEDSFAFPAQGAADCPATAEPSAPPSGERAG